MEKETRVSFSSRSIYGNNHIIMRNIIIHQCCKTVSLGRILANKSVIIEGSPLLYSRATVGYRKDAVPILFVLFVFVHKQLSNMY